MDWSLYSIGQNYIVPHIPLYGFQFDIMQLFSNNYLPIWNFNSNKNSSNNTMYENMGLSLSTRRTSSKSRRYASPAKTTRRLRVRKSGEHNSNRASLGARIAAAARKYLGFKESDNSYKKFTHGRAEAWCADFVSYVARECGLAHIDSPSVAGLLKYGKLSRHPKVGDAVIFRKFDKNNNEYLCHTGIVTRVEGGRVYTIEGNYSDKVAEADYDLNDTYIKGYVTLT